MRRRLFVLMGFAGAAICAAGEKKRKAADSYVVIAGTVFQDTGFSLPGAEVSVEPETAEGKKPKPVRGTSDARGEFAVRVPAVPAKYTVSVKKAGFQSQSKPVTIEAGQVEERYEVTFQLEPEKK